ncbi:MAG: hypothetical protein EXQ94_08375 [Alphaproteobacteria bacterium]|nr:hypothetical protein [Alphaproteobacteria bacterium]
MITSSRAVLVAFAALAAVAVAPDARAQDQPAPAMPMMGQMPMAQMMPMMMGQMPMMGQGGGMMQMPMAQMMPMMMGQMPMGQMPMGQMPMGQMMLMMPMMMGQMPMGDMGGMHGRNVDDDRDGIVSAEEAARSRADKFRRGDGDGDGRITQAEHDAFMAMMGKDGVHHDRMAEHFAAMDTDGDTAVSLREFMADAETRFKAADADADGIVTVWEYYAARGQ